MRRFTFLVIMILACAMAQAKIYVVSVGVSDYPGTENDLSFGANDARTIRDIYKKNGEVGRDSVETFITTEERANCDNIRAAMKTVFGKATEQDVIIFFFSGHGSTNSFYCFDGHLLHEEIVKIMNECKAKRKIIMADACHSGSLSGAQNELYEQIKTSNVMFFLSSRPEETSWGYRTEQGNSLFVSFLARGLRGAADANKDRIVTAREIFLFVNKGVSSRKIQRGDEYFVQHPVMWGFFDHNMPVISWKERTK